MENSSPQRANAHSPGNDYVAVEMQAPNKDKYGDEEHVMRVASFGVMYEQRDDCDAENEIELEGVEEINEEDESKNNGHLPMSNNNNFVSTRRNKSPQKKKHTTFNVAENDDQRNNSYNGHNYDADNDMELDESQMWDNEQDDHDPTRMPNHILSGRMSSQAVETLHSQIQAHNNGNNGNNGSNGAPSSTTPQSQLHAFSTDTTTSGANSATSPAASTRRRSSTGSNTPHTPRTPGTPYSSPARAMMRRATTGLAKSYRDASEHGAVVQTSVKDGLFWFSGILENIWFWLFVSGMYSILPSLTSHARY
jgi:hypothetical protein